MCGTTTVIFSKNKLNGTIPHSLGNCKYMMVLVLMNNLQLGRIPQSLNKCVDLQRLKVSENKLSGILDMDFPVSMTVLSAHSNNIFGIVPASLARCTKLQLLDLRKNELGSELRQFLKFFHDLSLSHNKLHGGLP